MDTTIAQQATHPLYFHGISFDAIFTVCAALFVFAVGYLADRLYDKYKERQRLKRVRQFVLTTLSQLLAPMDKQAEVFRQLASQIVADTTNDLGFEQRSDLYFDPLGNVSKLDVFDALMLGSNKLTNEKASHLLRVFATLDFIKTQGQSTARNFVEFIHDLRRYQRDWNENANAVLRQFDSIAFRATTSGQSVENDQFLNELGALVHAWSSKDDFRNRSVVIDSLLDPIRNLCRTIPDTRSNSLLSPIMNCLNADQNISHLLVFASDSFKDEAKRLADSRQRMSRCIAFFTDVKPRGWRKRTPNSVKEDPHHGI